MDKTTVFEPGSKEMKEEYPELNTIPEFENLSERELRFVWFFSNPTSPYNRKETRLNDRINFSLTHGFGDDLTMKDRQKYIKLSFPPHIKMAIERMESVELNMRQKAKMILNGIILKLEEIATRFDGRNIDEQRKYVELAIKIGLQLPALVTAAETGFGIKDKIIEKKEEKKTSKAKQNGAVPKPVSEIIIGLDAEKSAECQ